MRLLTRGSALALIQAELMAEPLRRAGHQVEIVPRATRGDRDVHSPLPSFGGVGAFSSCISEALLEGSGEGAVHSLKDLPSRCREGLALAAVLPREREGDVLVPREGHTLDTLPPGSVVGTSSPRRRAQLLRSRPDLEVTHIRGNLPTRLKKLKEGPYDAIILAAAGLERLGVMPGEASDLPFLPAPCQGIIALETPLGSELYELGRAITHGETHLCAAAERSLLRRLGVGCHVPFAALARMEGGILSLEAEIIHPLGSKTLSLSCKGPISSEGDAVRAGEALGERFSSHPEWAELLSAAADGGEKP
ncbi:MAG: hydroxymethylbilane synthase [Aminivibrio sp.]